MLNTEYTQFQNTLEVNMPLFCKYRGQVVVSRIENEYFYVRMKNGTETPQNLSDVGTVLFFSEADFKAITTSREVQLKYDPYQNRLATTLTNVAVKNSISQQNRDFFADKDYHEKQLYMERQHFDEVEMHVSAELKEAKGTYEGLRITSNGNSDSYDPAARNRVLVAEGAADKWVHIYNEPYFAEIVEKDGKRVYIGEKEIPGYVVDSRDLKYANLYRMWRYYQDDLELVRNFEIARAELKDFVDSLNKHGEVDAEAYDEFLLSIMQYNRDKQEVVNIARTIAEEQHRIIVRDKNENFVVEGCAGSGKTVIMFQRLASLVFNDSAVKEENLIVVSPNGMLDAESNAILKDLDIKRIKKGSINKLYKEWASEYAKLFDIESAKIFDFNQEITDNDFAEHEVINFLYKDIYGEFESILRRLTKDPYNCGFSFTKLEDTRIHSIQKQIYGGPLIPDGEMFKFYSEMESSFVEICRTLSRQNAEAKIERLEESLKSELAILERRKRFKSRNVPELERKELEYKVCCLEIEQKISKKETQRKELIRHYLYIDNTYKETDVLVEAELELILARIDRITLDIAEDRKSLKKEKEKFSKEKRSLIGDDRKTQELQQQITTLKFFVKTGMLRGDAIYNDNEKLSINNQLFAEAFKFYERYCNLTPNRIIELNDGFENFCLNNHIIMDRVRRYNAFLNGKIDAYIVDAIETLMSDWKRDFNIDESKFYDFELFYILKGLNLLYGPLSTDGKLVSVDEYQDYAQIEIDLIGQIHSNSVFNLYGEMKQNINAKGIGSIDENAFVQDYGYNCHTLKTNYRNGREITTYINDTFDFDMKAIGMPSSVDNLSIYAMDERKLKGDRRVALIVKSFEEYAAMKHSKTNDIFLGNEMSVLDKEKINVIPIRLAKGLEFEEVYVYEKGMSKNEKYVAFTRALEALHIVS